MKYIVNIHWLEGYGLRNSEELYKFINNCAELIKLPLTNVQDKTQPSNFGGTAE